MSYEPQIPQSAPAAPTPSELVRKLAEYKGRNDWQAISHLGRKLPSDWGAEWLEAADEVAFSLGQLHQTDAAVALYERGFSLAPTHRRASALAYLFYDAMLNAKNNRGGPALGEQRGGGPSRGRTADARRADPRRRNVDRVRPGPRTESPQRPSQAPDGRPGDGSHLSEVARPAGEEAAIQGAPEPARIDPSTMPSARSGTAHPSLAQRGNEHDDERPPRDDRGAPPAEAPRARDREADRQAFLQWIEEALRLRPDAIKDLYRLGEFEAQIQSKRDKAALKCFLKAIEIWHGYNDAERQRMQYLHKPYLRSLYCGARSAYRLGLYPEARRLIFASIREDERTHHIEPVHKLFLAARVCAAQNQPDHAERAFRLALDAKGPPRRDFIHAALATLLHETDRGAEALSWLDAHIRPHQRSAYHWRLVGDIHRDAGRIEQAFAAYRNALQRDHHGRHLTLVRMGDLHRGAGQLGEARRQYEQAVAFRRRKYLSEDRDALQGLLAIAEAQRDTALGAQLRATLAKLPRRRSEGPNDRYRDAPPHGDEP